MNLRVGAALFLAVPLLVAGCSSDGDGDTEPGSTTESPSSTSSEAPSEGESDEPTEADPDAPSKEDFLEEANAICRAGSEEVDAAAAEIQSAEQAEAFILETLVPSVRGQIEDIRALGFPAGDEATLTTILDDTEVVLDGVEADPVAAMTGDDTPFADVNKALDDYGLIDCGTA